MKLYVVFNSNGRVAWIDTSLSRVKEHIFRFPESDYHYEVFKRDGGSCFFNVDLFKV